MDLKCAVSGSGRQVGERRGEKRGRAQGNCDLWSSRQTSAQIFRCSQASEWRDAASPESSDIIAFLVKEPEGSRLACASQTSQLTLGDVWCQVGQSGTQAACFKRRVIERSCKASPSERRHASLFLNVLKRFYYLCNSLPWLWLSSNIQFTFNRAVPSHLEPTCLSSRSNMDAISYLSAGTQTNFQCFNPQ